MEIHNKQIKNLLKPCMLVIEFPVCTVHKTNIQCKVMYKICSPHNFMSSRFLKKYFNLLKLIVNH